MLTDGELAEARALALSTMTATLSIADPSADPGGWDLSTGPAEHDDAEALWSGPARIQAVRATSSGSVDAADQLIAPRTYKVALPHDAPALAPGTRATITTAPPEDPALAAKVLTVVSCILGGLGIERVLYCDLDTSNQPGV